VFFKTKYYRFLKYNKMLKHPAHFLKCPIFSQVALKSDSEVFLCAGQPPPHPPTHTHTHTHTGDFALDTGIWDLVSCGPDACALPTASERRVSTCILWLVCGLRGLRVRLPCAHLQQILNQIHMKFSALQFATVGSQKLFRYCFFF
jgi:hypothetical protein